MKAKSILFLFLVYASLLSCSNSKAKFNTELAGKMKLEVNYINNKMPSIDKGSTKYISFMVLPVNGIFDENWRTTSLTATSGNTKTEFLKFDNNEFEGKSQEVYRNTARMNSSNLSPKINITVILVSESGECVKLIKSNVKEKIVE